MDLNRQGAAPMSQLPALAALTAPEVLRLQKEGAVVVDTRPAMQFAVAHVPGSIHIALTGQYASWAARILGLRHASDHRRRRSGTRARVADAPGARRHGECGRIPGGWRGRLGQERVSSSTIFPRSRFRISSNSGTRNPIGSPCWTYVNSENEASGAIEKSLCIPLGKLKSRIAELDREKLLVVHCKGGYRSSIATSILRRAGFRNIANLTGGFDAWKAAGLPYVVPAANAN